MVVSPLRVQPTRPIAVDLFSGAGGMSLGFEQAGFDVVAAVEYDPVHAATHAFNFPECEVLCRDISTLGAADVLAVAERGFKKLHPRGVWPGRLDALIGGPPCQGFSTGGKRDQEDERNDLLLHYVRLVEELKPRTFCLENVAGLLEKKFDPVRQEAFERLRKAGYAISGTEKTVNSLEFGVPQSRRRVIVLGARGNKAPLRPAPSNAPNVSVEEAFEGLPSPGDYDALLTSDEVLLNDEDIQRRQSIVGSYARTLAGLQPLAGDKSRPRLWEPGLLTGSRRTIHTDATVERFATTELGAVEPKSRLYRLPLSGPSRTLRAGTGSERGSHTSPRPIHPREDRVITVREAARLHGYPDWFRFHTTNWHGHRQVGNSVPPPLARAAARALLGSIASSPVALRATVALGDVSLLSLSRTKALTVVDALTEQLPAQRTRKPTVADTSDPEMSQEAVG
ncbi:DNA cytosine methyltransferase [Microbacterium sp. KKR3/1]|uniref:DNA cytosine methyltransferase n=1 Tax=Microbacterium sp. KKR3/1 TaxID=2904241 RepID=UPI001E5BC88D|nr:DNA cytosine methyltransferase [Microbacterium sp. KKR3/1]MCE0507436.1 DNA cytosine methyltransferase [Microbacterium sp. KKR3/1]